MHRDPPELAVRVVLERVLVERPPVPLDRLVLLPASVVPVADHDLRAPEPQRQHLVPLDRARSGRVERDPRHGVEERGEREHEQPAPSRGRFPVRAKREAEGGEREDEPGGCQEVPVARDAEVRVARDERGRDVPGEEGGQVHRPPVAPLARDQRRDRRGREQEQAERADEHLLVHELGEREPVEAVARRRVRRAPPEREQHRGPVVAGVESGEREVRRGEEHGGQREVAQRREPPPGRAERTRGDDEEGRRHDRGREVERKREDEQRRGQQQGRAALHRAQRRQRVGREREREERVVLDVAEVELQRALPGQHGEREHVRGAVRAARGLLAPQQVTGGRPRDRHEQRAAQDAREPDREVRDLGGAAARRGEPPRRRAVEDVVQPHRKRLVRVERLARGDVPHERVAVPEQRVAFAEDPEHHPGERARERAARPPRKRRSAAEQPGEPAVERRGRTPGGEQAGRHECQAQREGRLRQEGPGVHAPPARTQPGAARDLGGDRREHEDRTRNLKQRHGPLARRRDGRRSRGGASARTGHRDFSAARARARRASPWRPRSGRRAWCRPAGPRSGACPAPRTRVASPRRAAARSGTRVARP